MDIVMLAAGTSSRMGKVNKMLLDIDGRPMVCASCIKALEYLESLDEKSSLIVVTGYRSTAVLKALKPCMSFIKKTDRKLGLKIIKNSLYRDGQFSSVKTGLAEVEDGKNFFISLADMPRVDCRNYEALANELGSYDVVRPFFENQPGHPVLFSAKMKPLILAKDNSWSVSRILKTCVEKDKIKELPVSDSSWVFDIDTKEDFISRNSEPDTV